MTSEQDTMVALPLLRDLTYREWHGFVDGLYCGVRWGDRPHSYDRERHYWRSGYLVGTALRYVAIVAIYLELRADDD